MTKYEGLIQDVKDSLDDISDYIGESKNIRDLHNILVEGISFLEFHLEEAKVYIEYGGEDEEED